MLCRLAGFGFLFLFLIFFNMLWCFASMYVCIENVGSPGTGVTSICESPFGRWELVLGPAKVKCSETSLQTLCVLLKSYDGFLDSMHCGCLFL